MANSGGPVVTDDLTVRRWGDGGWSTGADMTNLSPEPVAPAQVQLDMFHPVFGDRPVFVKWVKAWVPVGWVPVQPATWEQLFRWNRHRPPTVLEPPPACGVTS